jgi:prepilin-type N-terminal cleavage/methylation domain-containing protein
MRAGFTLIEVVVVLVIAGILIAIAVPSYERYLERSRLIETTYDLGTMQKTIKGYEVSKGALPDALADVGYGTKLDPWGRPYEYLNLRNMKGNGKARKDKSLAPLNSDFDLYSIGRDGLTEAALSNKASRDDVVRARDGRFIGPAEEFDP